MRNILVTGAGGVIGQPLVMELRNRGYNVVAANHRKPLPDHIRNGGPHTTVDVRDDLAFQRQLAEYGIDTVYHLGSLLSLDSKERPFDAIHTNGYGTMNVLTASHLQGVEKVIIPSSIAVFGPKTGRYAPEDAVLDPQTLYGALKVVQEILGDQFRKSLGLDVRGFRIPGVKSYEVEPSGGTTDRIIRMYYAALLDGKYDSPLEPHTKLPFILSPDNIEAHIRLGEAPAEAFGDSNRAGLNLYGFTLSPRIAEESIRRRGIPGFTVDYKNINPELQSIADSWPEYVVDEKTRRILGLKPISDVDAATDYMLENLDRKLSQEGRKGLKMVS